MNLKQKRIDQTYRIVFLFIPLAFFLIITIFPFYWIFNTSLKDSTEVVALPIKYWPSAPSFSNYLTLFGSLGFGNNFLNSVLVAFPTTLVVTFLSLLSGYAMSRYQFKGKNIFYIFMIITQMLPAVVLMIPLFKIMNSLHLINNLVSLILVCSCTNLAYCMFMMMGYFNAVPRELEEAARVDGCSLLGAVFRILLPAMKPSIVATGAYVFINAWNVYVYATVFITKVTKYTLPLAMAKFQSESGTEYGLLAAGCVVALIPVIALFSLVQRNMSSGATAGAVKG